MGLQKKQKIRKIQQSHGTYYIGLPIELMRQLGWQERQKVIIKRKGQGILIVDWK